MIDYNKYGTGRWVGNKGLLVYYTDRFEVSRWNVHQNINICCGIMDLVRNHWKYPSKLF